MEGEIGKAADTQTDGDSVLVYSFITTGPGGGGGEPEPRHQVLIFTFMTF